MQAPSTLPWEPTTGFTPPILFGSSTLVRLATWPGFLTSFLVPETIAAASSDTFRSSFGIVSENLPLWMASLISGPAWRVQEVIPFFAPLDRGLPSVSIAIPLLIPLVEVRTPVAISPMTSLAVPMRISSYYAFYAPLATKVPTWTTPTRPAVGTGTEFVILLIFTVVRAFGIVGVCLCLVILT